MAGCSRRRSLPSLLHGAVTRCLSVVTYPRDLLGDTHPFERQRRAELRTGNFVYRWFEPVVDDLAKFLGRNDSESLKSLGVSLTAGREKLPWKPEEFLAAKWIEAVLLGGGLFLVLWLGSWTKTAVVLGIGITLIVRIHHTEVRLVIGPRSGSREFVSGCHSPWT